MVTLNSTCIKLTADYILSHDFAYNNFYVASYIAKVLLYTVDIETSFRGYEWICHVATYSRSLEEFLDHPLAQAMIYQKEGKGCTVIPGHVQYGHTRH